MIISLINKFMTLNTETLLLEHSQVIDLEHTWILSYHPTTFLLLTVVWEAEQQVPLASVI